MSTAAHVRGKFMIAAATFFTLIGSAWGIAALALWPARPAWSIPVGSMATVALLALCIMRLKPLRNTPSIYDPMAAAKGKRMGKLFGIVLATESGLIFLCATLLARLGLGIWIPIAVALIVGLHFIPLARIFEATVYYWTGSLCVFGVLGCSLIRDAGTRVLCAALMMAAVFWLTAIVLLLQAKLSGPVAIV